jgi:hypothetical protein
VTITAEFSDWKPTPDDMITVSCGPTHGLDDYLDAVTLLDAAVANPVQVTFTNLVRNRLSRLFLVLACPACLPALPV